MKITSNFNRLYWGAIINDIALNLDSLVWNGIKFNLKVMDKESIHKLLKIITFNDKSLTEMSSKEVVGYLEDIRLLLAENGHSLTIDDEEFYRMIKNI